MPSSLQYFLSRRFQVVHYKPAFLLSILKKLLVPKESFKLFHGKIVDLQKKYPDRIEDGNILNHDQIYNIIADYKDEKLYAMTYGFIAVRPNGDISFLFERKQVSICNLAVDSDL